MKDKLQKIGLVLGSAFLTLAFIEFLLAIPVYYFVKGNGNTFYSRPHLHWLFEEDPVLGFKAAPNLKKKNPPPPGLPNAPRRKMWFDLETDNNGFRYNDHLYGRKPPDEIRIFSLGGSTTFGAESPNKMTYPQQLEDLIHDPKIRVINAGVGGYRSIHLLKYYQKVIRNFEPDIITIYSGWNDFEDFIASYWEPKNPHGHALKSQFELAKIPFGNFSLVWGAGKLYYSFKGYNRTVSVGVDVDLQQKYLRKARSQVWQNEHRDNIQELISVAKADGVIPVLIIFPSPQFENASSEVKSYADQDINMAGNWDAFVIALRHIRSNLRVLAEENGIPLIDVNNSFEKLNNDYKAKFNLFVDRQHLTPKGNTVIAETMLDPIRNIIKQRKLRILNRS
ncbi:MAG: hypothetical protein CL768_03065 [Chloroflexi bacterium]|nr:hypothetical protein [Chloroflexota bacterium]